MDRLISEKSVLEAFREYQGSISDFYKAVKAMPSVEPQWIPVSERLPTEEEYIANNGLFIVSDGNRIYAEYFDVYCSMRFGEPTIRGFRVDYAVTVWMPLPSPYKGEQYEGDN